MESPEGTIPGDIERELAAHEGAVPISVEGQVQLDTEALIPRVMQLVSGNRGQREWALARTKLEEAVHWMRVAREIS